MTITLTDSILSPGQVTVKIASDPPLGDHPTPAQLLGADIVVALGSYDFTKELN